MNRRFLPAMLCSLLLLAACSDEPATTAASEDKILQGLLYFAPLGYTSTPPGRVFRFNKEELPDTGSRFWRLEAFALPAYARIDADQFIDRQNLSSLICDFRITESDSLPLELQAAWIHLRSSAKPVHKGLSRWFPFMLSRDTAALIAADRERRSKLAETLADKAYFFGYATDEDALK